MILFYYNKDKINHARMIRYLHDSYDGAKQLLETSEFFSNMGANIASKFIVFAGMIRGDGLIYQWCQQNKKEFLYIDHAYLGRGYNSDADNEWMRISRSAFVWNKMKHANSNRWEKHFAKNYRLSPWGSNNGSKVLVLPPSTATKFLFPDCNDWMNRTLELLRRNFSSDQIIIREKPDQVILDQKTNKIISRIAHNHSKTIEEELLDARLVVTYSSAVPVTGLILGIPCLTSENAAAYPMSVKYENLLMPEEPDRIQWLHQLVHHQYTVAEMKSGIFWRMFREHNDD